MKTKRARRPFNKVRLKNQILNIVTNPFNMIVFITLIILFCLIVIPLLQMLASPLPWVPVPRRERPEQPWVSLPCTTGNTF